MTTALARIEATPAAELFKPGALDPILETIKAEVRREAACLDISTEANRKALASLAFKVAKSKTFLDAQGKKLVAGEKERLKVIDKERGRVWDELELLQTEVRKPLTDWENAAKERVAKHEAALEIMEACGILILSEWQTYSLEKMRAQMEHFKNLEYDWQEFQSRALTVYGKTIGQIKEAIAKREKYDAEQEELIALREAKLIREQQERDVEIARKAKEEAEIEDRNRAYRDRVAHEAECERIETERFEAEARATQAEAQRVAAEEKAQKDAEEAAERLRAAQERAEAAAKAAAEKAVRDAAAAAQKAEADQKAAVEAERKRVADAELVEKAAAQKREANKRHAAKINGEVEEGIRAQIFSDDADEIAKSITEAIAKGLIPHTKISY